MKESDYVNVQILTELRCVRAILRGSLAVVDTEGKEAQKIIREMITKYEKKVRT
jgi:hypothetical protein